ncbi:XRE family transcriptional regulator [Pseudomonas sp. HMWF032]|uniref:LexA family protein n=1 Tax=Pseudomonas sp. HMWF032 TaxID=2056866 RepID=UPI000D335135|nr:XRE family transcriptional regulator [Pseudomonas sp. HMWF032]PTS84012.1 XRE family transcriptional regulator [Pseudomonas sp. HMWF032]PTT85367.1 XRE family transcriptional regulator [Pseudomonas sp. HMWF010]
MNTLGSRIAHYRQLSGMSQAKLARACGWSSQSRIGNYEKDSREPTLADIELISKVLGIRPEQLMAHEPINEHSNLSPALQPHRSAQAYPLISWVAAGERAESPDNYHPGDGEELIESTENAGATGYWLSVKGQSMKSDGSPSFPDGIKILVKSEGFDVINGKFYIAKHRDGETTFKQYTRDAGTEYLVPLNPAFKTVEMDGEWRIIGRVVDAKITGL